MEEVDDKEELDYQTEDHCIEREGEPTRLLDTRLETPYNWSDTFAPTIATGRYLEESKVLLREMKIRFFLD